MPMIKIKGLSYTYSNSSVPALREISANFPAERAFAVLGESGSGKTTLLNCIARFLKPQSGSILIEGKNINKMTENEFRRTLGVVFQKLNLFPHLTVLDNMTLAPIKAFGQDSSDAKKSASKMLQRLGIADLSSRYPSQISGGQAQRVAIARGLMLQPKYILLDEPTSALDTKTTFEFAKWLRELREGTSLIIVTHDLPFASEVATHGIYLDAGRLTAEGSIKEIASKATTKE